MSSARQQMTRLNRNTPLRAAFLDDPLQLVGCFQRFRRQRFQILDDGFETAHDLKVHRYPDGGNRALGTGIKWGRGESPRMVPMRYALGIL